MTKPKNWGDLAAQKTSLDLEKRVSPGLADTTALAAVVATERYDGLVAVTLDTGNLWVFRASSVVAASATIIAPAAGTGRWHRLGTAATS